MQTSNIFEALASPPALDENSENQDPNLKTSTYTFKEKPHRPILGEITNTLPLQQVSTEPVKPAAAKPIVIENPHIAAPKDWEEIGQKTELKVNVTPDVEEKVHEYEAQFPALGETATETLKPESNFDTEILSPANIAVAQSHHDSTVDNTDNTGSLRDSINTEYILSQSAQSREVTPQNAQAHVYPEQTKTAARPVIIESTSIGPGRDWKDTAQRQLKSRIITTPQMEEKVHQYESLFPALGEQPVETPKEEEEEVFYPEEVLDPINIALAQSQVESQIESQLSMSTESLETKPVKTPQAQAKPRREIVLNPDTLLLESVEIKPQKPKEVTVYLNPDTLLLESDMPRTERPHHEPAKPMPKPVILENPSGPAKDWEGLDQSMKQSNIKETLVKEENVQVYESHFPALGDQVKASEPMTEFAPEILTSEPVAETPKKSAAYARKFDQMLETEIEQLDQTNLNKAGDLEKKFRGQDQRLRQDWQIQGQSDLEPIEENIEIQDETEDFKATKKGTQYAKFTSRPRVRSSLEDIPEENIMNRSTELTLSAQRIDLIKEELRESEHKIVDEDPIFQAVERDLDFVKECEKTRMYGEAIRSLKRTLEALDVRFIRYQDFDIAEMNKLLYECNVQLAYCYNQIHEIRSTIDHARAALKFNPESTRAMYFLGTTLIKAGDVVGGYDVLRQMRRLSPVTKDVYRELIELELRRYERRAQEILKGLEEPDKSKDEPSPVAGIGCFVGTALSSGLFSWFLMRNSLGFSERKSWAYAIGAGTVLGGLSLMLMGHNVRK